METSLRFGGFLYTQVMSKNYYDILGISKTASTDDIKKAYKKLAMEYHPDRNKDDASAEKKFKEINEAYQVLGDAEKKKQYDQFWSADFGGFSSGNPFGWEFSQTGGGFSGGFDFGDIFSGFRRQRETGGGGFGFDFGDMFRTSSDTSHRASQASENLDVTETVEIPFLDFLFDTKVSVKNVYGEHISLKVKASTQPGTKFRIRGKGRKSGNTTGDMFVIVNAKMPKEIPDHIQKMLEAIRYEL